MFFSTKTYVVGTVICLKIRIVYPILFNPYHTIGVLWFHVRRLCVHPTVCLSVAHPSVFGFQMIA